MRRTHALRSAIAAITVLTSLATTTGSASAVGASTISGTAFNDADRDGAPDVGETPMANQQLYLFDAARQTYLGTVVTDSAGHYAFSGLADGDYSVDYASGSWQPLKEGSVPTTTGSAYPRHSVHLVGAATADFGWRPIVRSTTLGAPISKVVAASGLTVESYTDAVPAQVISDVLSRALVGDEAPSVTVRFGYGSTDATTTGAQQTNGRYTAYSAMSYTTYGSWLDLGDQALTHEYGHAWSIYNAYIVQQDASFATYVEARGLTGDSRLNSSYAWNVREMIAEDYRQLFGSANAAAMTQTNGEIPRAASVPGLKTFLQGAFMTAPTSSAPAPTSSPTAPTITGLSVSPQPVVKSGTMSFSLSTSANVTVQVLDQNGTVVRTLLADAPRSAGVVNVTWDRKDTAGRRVAGGTYRSVVTATAGGTSAAASATFAVK